MHHRFALSLLPVAALATIFACSSSSTTSTPTDTPDATIMPMPGTEGGTPTIDAGPDPLMGCTRDPGAPAGSVDPNASSDPTGGAAKFTLAMALAGFPSGGGKLTAGISTEKAGIKCTLDETNAPISVANFVGLARGTRPYKAGGKWKLGHFYDGLTWHRVIPDFVIQGGDPDGDGTGGPGYDLVKENQVAEPLGTLAMAASTQVSGSQFYIVVGTGPKAEYNVFGSCTTENAIAIAAVDRDSNDMPKTPVHMIKVEIARCP
jgi:peptidyl-prolyl cis-trans isomerase A (cyclophilin A)